MSPNGSATIAPFQDRPRKEGWVVVMFVEAKNGEWGPIFGDMLATDADVTKRVRIQEGLKFGTGFSGGSRGTSMLTQVCPGCGGELLNSAGCAFSNPGDYENRGIPKGRPYAVFMAMGMNDSNFSEIDKIRYALPAGVGFKAKTFAPTLAEMLDDGLNWLLQQTFGSDKIRDDFRAFSLRHFDYLAARLKLEPTGPRQRSRA